MHHPHGHDCYMNSKPCPSFPCFFGERHGKPQKKQGYFIPTEPLKSLEKKGKNAQKNKEFLAGRKKQGIPKKQGKEGQGRKRSVCNCPCHLGLTNFVYAVFAMAIVHKQDNIANTEAHVSAATTKAYCSTERPYGIQTNVALKLLQKQLSCQEPLLFNHFFRLSLLFHFQEFLAFWSVSASFGHPKPQKLAEMKF